MSRKSELATKVSSILTELTAAGLILKYLRCDNAGENIKGFSVMYEKCNILIKLTAPYTPQQNGMVKQKFATIQDWSCTAMTKAKFTEKYHGLLWAESVHTRLTSIVSNKQGDE